MTTFAGLALLPDADVAGLSFGVTDYGPYGHRGYSHSLLFAVAIAGAAYWVARKWGTRPWYTAFLVLLAVCSHGILDAMTYRTRGIPFFWPFDDMRVTFPWRPIPPAPTGIRFLSKRGLEVMGVELVYFMPLVLAALLPRLHTLRRWLSRCFRFPGKRPVTFPGPELTATRAAVRVGGSIALVAASLLFAQVYLSQSRLVAWIEQSTQQNLAVSLMRNPEFRHLH